MEVREVRDRADARGLDRVNRRAWRTAYADLLPADALDRDPAGEDALDRLLAALDSWAGVGLVAVDDRVVGYAVARWDGDTKPFVAAGDAGLKELYVDPDRWREGVGTALLSAVERRVPDGCAGLTLSTLAGNDAARAFYEARGFRRVGTESEAIADREYETAVYRKPLDGPE